MHIREDTFKDLVLETGLVDENVFEKAKTEALRSERTIMNVLIGRGDLSEDFIGNVLANFWRVEPVNLREVEIPSGTLEMLPEVLAKAKNIILFEFDPKQKIAKLAMEDPGDLATIAYLEAKLGMRVVPYLAMPTALRQGLKQYKRKIGEEFNRIIEENIKKARVEGRAGNIARMAQELPIITILDSIIEHAITLEASDIHFEPLEDRLLIRYRIDGILREMLQLPKPIHPILVARVKVLANLQIDEHFKPQDGRFSFSLEDEPVDIRVSIMPVFYGEKIEMRLLRGAARPLSLAELGFGSHDTDLLDAEIKKTHGMILSTGPTGSGKTTTLYAILHILNQPERNICTIEDPIEYSIQRINQTQVNVRTGVTFATGLRSLLRQDPDILMVGEIRDEETADIAVHAALTGHLVLSTLHTNDAPTALPRLIDMGIQPFLLATTVNVVIGQRLVRKICDTCVHSFAPEEQIGKSMALQIERLAEKGEKGLRPPKLLFAGRGCKACGHSGYRGQTGIFEVMLVTEAIKKLILRQAPTGEIRRQAMADGMATMFADGLGKVEAGITTIEEVLRVVRE